MVTDRSSVGGAAAAGGVDYQALVGAYMAVRMLGEAAIPALWELPVNVVLTRLWAESGAPVDDVLVTTSSTGYIYIQAKRTVGISDRLDSTLGEAFQQFVKLYLTSPITRHRGTNEMRPLDANRDRVVLVTSSATGPVQNLTSVLRRLREMGTAMRPRDCTVNDGERSALARVVRLTRRCWRDAGSPTPSWNEIAPFLQLIWISVFRLDTDENDEQLAKYWLRDKILVKEIQADTAWTTLKDKAIGLAKRRSGLERTELQRALIADGISLRALRSYETDMDRLQQQTRTNLRTLLRFSRIQYDGSDITIRREYEAILDTEARARSLVVIGEAGCGKSALLGLFAERVRDEGCQVIVLNAGELAAASLGQLRQELALDHELLDIIEQWNGDAPAFLVIDALDSARDERTAATLRLLVERVQELEGRWRVVATIRKFDLRNGKHWQQVVPGQGIRPHFDAAFDDVRHLNIGPLSATEIETLKDQAPALHAMVEAAPPAVAELLRVPFNLMLANELRRAGGENDLATVTTQLSLLDRYWDRRIGVSLVERASNESVLHEISESMVRSRHLHVSAESITLSTALETLLSRSVLIAQNARLQYAHHILFDYAVERLLLRPDSSKTIARIESDRDLPITVGPSLKYWLEGTWERDTTRGAFWELSLRLVSSNAPAIAKIVSGRVAADKTSVPGDCADLVSAAATEGGQRIFMFVADAITASVARIATIRPNPWFFVLERLPPAASAAIFHRGSFLLHALLDAITDPSQIELTAAGRFARQALTTAWSLPTRNRSLVVAAIRAVGRTFRSNVLESETLLRRALATEHVVEHGHEELPWLARSAIEFTASPAFLVELYATTFGATASGDEETTLSNSQILGLTSNKKQDLAGARWQLGECFEAIAKQDIALATAIAVRVVNQYALNQDEGTSTANTVEFSILGATGRFSPDRYLVRRGARDEEPEIVDELAQQFVRIASESDRVAELPSLIRYVAEHNRTELLWEELIEATDGAPELFLALRELLFSPPVLSLFSKHFALSLRSHHGLLSPEDRARTESSILTLRDSGYGDVTAFRLLQALGAEALSNEGRAWFEEQELERRKAASERRQLNNDDSDEDEDDDAGTYVLRESGMTPEDLRSDSNRTARRRTKDLRSSVQGLTERPGAETLEPIERELRDLQQYIASQPVHAAQVASTWGALAEVATALAERGLDSVADVLVVASQRPEPLYYEDQEQQFARSPGWGGGQSRMEAAPGLMEIAARSEREDVLTAIGNLARDRVSSVRFAIGRQLPNIAKKHQKLYWELLDTLVQDSNPSVVGWLHLGHALWLDPERGLALVVRVYEKWLPQLHTHSSLVEALFNLLLDQSLYIGAEPAREIVDEAVTRAVENSELISHAVMHLRHSLTQPRKPDAANPVEDEARLKAIAYVERATSVTLATLRQLAQLPSPTDEDRDRFRRAAKLLIDITQEVYFASLAYDEKHEARKGKPDPAVRIRFFNESESILRGLATVGTAGSTHYLIETLSSFIDLVDPVKVFLLIAEAVRAGRKGGYQYETLAVKEIVSIVERYLADFRVVFVENEECRAGLRDILDTFVEAGWPETHRLVFSLDSIFR